MPGLLLENVTKVFPPTAAASAVTAIDRFSLAVREGTLLVLLGPSGCGKTTLLRLVAGLAEPSSGRILIDGQSLAGVPAQKRSIAMAFQYPALLPQLTVRENIALAPKLRGESTASSATRAEELANLLAIAELLGRLPETLSGGQQQRVSLARALAARPSVLLLDEPLANLDPGARAELREAIRTIQQKLRVTTIYVTHDQAEATAVADEIALIDRGKLQQAGRAAELYRGPANLFVAEFFGPTRPNFFSATLSQGVVRPEGLDCTFAIAGDGPQQVKCAIRPTAIRAGGPLTGQLQEVRHTGWSTHLLIDLRGLRLRAELPYSPGLHSGEPFPFDIDQNDILLFDLQSGLKIR